MMTIETLNYTMACVQRVLNDVMFRQREEKAQEEQFVATQNYASAAACQQRFVGLMMAENHLREELRNLGNIKKTLES